MFGRQQGKPLCVVLPDACAIAMWRAAVYVFTSSLRLFVPPYNQPAAHNLHPQQLSHSAVCPFALTSVACCHPPHLENNIFLRSCDAGSNRALQGPTRSTPLLNSSPTH